MPPVLQLVVPCYNEADRLDPEPFLLAVRADSGLGIVFVDDGSTDATATILAGLSAKSEGRISLLRLDHNAGKAAAVRSGVLEALNRDPAYVGFWDADLSTPLTALPEFMEVFAQRPDVDIVIGARVKLLGRDIRRRLIRHYSGRIFATAASFALGIGVYDTQCGAKIFRATGPVRSAFDRPFRSRWIFDVEILSRYVAACGTTVAESRIYELPLRSWKDVPGSKLKLRHAVRAAWDLARITRR
ncbi:MAG TPA: glycosyltransferase [Vicinamibacterales bacterium]|nr:glycosyltransferase [Vicinamibacterales bacterium]